MRLAILLAMSAALLGVQGTSGEEAAVRDVVRRYVEARERMDVKAVEALFTEDADQLVSSGEWRRGRADVVKGSIASSQQSSGKRTIEVETVRFLVHDVAIADGRYEIAGAAADGGARKMRSTFVMVRGKDGWKISAIRNMLPADAAR